MGSQIGATEGVDSSRREQDERPHVSVIVAARNEEATLPALLDALGHQIQAPPFEVLFVDDASSDRTPNLIVGSGLGRLVRLPTHGGPAAARNAGIEVAEGDLLAFTDADCVPSETWIVRGVQKMKDSRIELLGGHVSIPLGDHPSLTGLVDLTYFDQERHISEGHAASANLWVRRQVIDRIGGFNATLRGEEDTDFTRRAVAAGLTMAYAPDVVVAHAHVGARAMIRRSFNRGLAWSEQGESHLRSRVESGPYAPTEYVRARLREAGHEPSPTRVASVYLAKTALVRMPLAAGLLVGTVRKRLRTPQ